MKITKLVSFAAIGFTIVCIVSFGANIAYRAIVNQERQAMEKKETLIGMGESFLSYSENLTKSARAYVQFADDTQYEAYKREKSLKSNDTENFLQTLKSFNITQNEFDAIQSAIEYQNQLVALEEKAFHEVMNSLENARVILFSAEYEMIKMKITDCLDEYEYYIEKESHYEIAKARKEADIASIILSAIQAFNMLLGIGCFVWIYLKLRPIKTLIDASQKIAHGDLDVVIHRDSRDEIGELYHSFGYLTDNIQSVNRAINEQLESIVSGDFSKRADASLFEGEWKKNIEGLNHVIEAFIQPLNETIDVLDEVSKNNFEVQVVGNYKGDFARIKKKLNSTIDSINNYLFEIQRLAVGIQNADSGIIIRDKDKKITSFNSGAEKILGYKAEEVIGCRDVFAPCMSNTEEEDFFDLIFKGNDYQSQVTDMLRKDGTHVFCNITVAPIGNKLGECIGFCSIFHDITERIKMEREIVAASQTKSLFLANMSHEIRTPMNGILGLLELTLSNSKLDDKTRDYLNKIQLSALGLLDIVNDILDISKIEAGELKLEAIPFSLQQVFQECESINALKAAGKGIELDFQYQNQLNNKLLGDPTRLRQALLNIISNAIKFTEKGYVFVTAAVEELVDNQVKIYFEVRDSGIGMTREQAENIFQVFKQADESTTRKFGGTGLGLSITKNIIERMGGEIKVESEPAVGSVFSFALEFELSDEPDLSTVTHEYHSDDIKIPKFIGKILLCEDNEINQMVAVENFERVGLEVIVAENGQIGVEKVIEANADGLTYDLIFMDVHMPVMDGIMATAEILALGYDRPIIAMTANAMKEDRDMCLNAGMTEYLSKPFNVDDVWEIFYKYLRQA